MSYKIRRSAPVIKEIQRTALMKWVGKFLAIAMTASLLSIGSVNGAPTDTCSLDPTFGQRGKVLSDFGSQAWAHAAKLQSDGKIVAVGLGYDGTDWVFALARYNSDGSFDTAFGSGGKVFTEFFDGKDRKSVV